MIVPLAPRIFSERFARYFSKRSIIHRILRTLAKILLRIECCLMPRYNIGYYLVHVDMRPREVGFGKAREILDFWMHLVSL